MKDQGQLKLMRIFLLLLLSRNCLDKLCQRDLKDPRQEKKKKEGNPRHKSNGNKRVSLALALNLRLGNSSQEIAHVVSSEYPAMALRNFKPHFRSCNFHLSNATALHEINS